MAHRTTHEGDSVISRTGGERRSDGRQARGATALVDGWGRRIQSLRLSVTDRCNLRCLYCMPGAGPVFVPRDRLLRFEELARVARVARRLGVRAVRITGGEPLLRRGLERLVEMLKRDAGVDDVALTTNALLLESAAEGLARAGLDRVNVSLDSLEGARFRRMTGRGRLDRVLAGIEAAERAGLHPIRINVVVVRGLNDDELDHWVDVVAQTGWTVRFLELMPVGRAGIDAFRRGWYVPVARLRDRLVERRGLQPCEAVAGNGPARYWRVPGTQGVVGFITPLSEPYCTTCSRMRLDSTGVLRPCLASNVAVGVGAAARAGDEAAIEAGLREAAARKPAGHSWNLHPAFTGAGASGRGGAEEASGGEVDMFRVGG